VHAMPKRRAERHHVASQQQRGGWRENIARYAIHILSTSGSYLKSQIHQVYHLDAMLVMSVP
jgi:hypothetical protein